MKSEIRILLEDGASNKAKGNCFENLIRNILYIHQYEIRGNINYSGMEIDLVATHIVINFMRLPSTHVAQHLIVLWRYLLKNLFKRHIKIIFLKKICSRKKLHLIQMLICSHQRA